MKNHLTYTYPRAFSHNFIIFFAFLIVSINGVAQDFTDKLNKANEKFKAFAYIDARAIYLDVAEQGYFSSDLYQKLADSYYLTGELEASQEWYERFVEEYPQNITPEYLFKYAQSLKSVERYQEADEVMDQFYAITGTDKRAKSFANKRDYLSFIELQSGRFDLFMLSINSKNSEYAPSFNEQNQIVFASSRGKKAKKSKVHGWNKMPFLDLYSSTIKEDGINLEEPVKLKGEINSKFHESSTSFSPDGETVYFSRNNYINNKLGTSKKGVVLLKLYKATLNDGKWTDIEELPFSSDNYSVSHPSVSLDGKKLYFASDMPGTFGKSDLFVVDILANGEFSSPKNLGENINTEGRETFPYISNNGELYFSSDGHVGLGGLDIFVSIPSDSGFSKAFNVGKPINSPKDDFTFVINEDTKVGYFASNRKGGKGNDDIYAIKQTKDLITSCKQFIEGIISNTETNESLPNTLVSLLDIGGNMISTTTTNSLGEYKFEVDCSEEYLIRTSLEQFNPREIAVSTDDVFEFINEISIPITPLNSDNILLTNIEVNVGDDLAKTLQLEPIHFALNDTIITTQAEIELQKIISAMKKYPELKIEVRSHTDSRSSFWYNKRLSVKRMRATVQYLVETGGIYWRRIRGKAYGERRLLNQCKDDIPCTEEEHRENRRSEFIVWD